jgi:hypothetical protein
MKAGKGLCLLAMDVENRVQLSDLQESLIFIQIQVFISHPRSSSDGIRDQLTESSAVDVVIPAVQHDFCGLCRDAARSCSRARLLGVIRPSIVSITMTSHFTAARFDSWKNLSLLLFISASAPSGRAIGQKHRCGAWP